MKYLLVFCLQLTLCSLTAQSSSRSVTERTTNNGYEFSVKMDRGQQERLLSAFEAVVSYELSVKVEGLIREELNNGITLELNTRRNKLSVNYSGENEVTLSEAKEIAVRIKDVLSLAPAAAPQN